MSRVKRRFTHPPYWHAIKNLQVTILLLLVYEVFYLNVFKLQKSSETLTEENEGFVKEIIQDKYGQISPIKGSDLANNQWNPKTQRTGVIAKNIGKYPLWKKDGSKIYCTLLQVITFLIFYHFIH